MRGVSRKGLQERCRLVEAELVSVGARKAEDFKERRPHGRAGMGAGPWLVYLLNLTREAATARAAERIRVTPEIERNILDALRNKPEVVELATPLRVDEWTDPITSLTIYQKSLTALIEIHYWDAEMERLGPYSYWLRQSREAQDLELLRRVLERILYVQRVLVWIVTTGRDGVPAACPYGKDVLEPVPPAWLENLDAVDVTRILRAYVRVNRQRLADLSVVTRLAAAAVDLSRNTRPSWSQFVGQQAEDLNVSPEDIADRWSLMSLVARQAMKLKSHHEAKEAAKQKASAHRGAA